MSVRTKEEWYKFCGICRKKLSSEEILRLLPELSPLDTCVTCPDHKKYNRIWLIEVVQKKLGIILEYSERMKKCEICDSDLNANEINSIEETDHIVTCFSHREVRDWCGLYFVKKWFEYKELHPNANYENHKTSFHRWFTNHPPLV